jgi:hypothetical protein
LRGHYETPCSNVSSGHRAVPKYNLAAEAVYKGTVCARPSMSGQRGVGTHIIMKLENGNTIEVHLATTEFTKMVEMNL